MFVGDSWKFKLTKFPIIQYLTFDPKSYPSFLKLDPIAKKGKAMQSCYRLVIITTVQSYLTNLLSSVLWRVRNTSKDTIKHISLYFGDSNVNVFEQ